MIAELPAFSRRHLPLWFTALLWAREARITDITKEGEVNNPYGLRLGPDGALYICEIGNHRISKLDLQSRAITTVIGSRKEPYDLRFDLRGLLYFTDMPAHQVFSLDLKSGKVAVAAGTGTAGFSGDGGPAEQAQLKQPHSIAFDPAGRLLICDIGNHRIRMVDKGVISTFAGTGEQAQTPEGAPRAGTPLNGPRAMDFDNEGNMYLVLREGNCVLQLDRKTDRYRRVAPDTKFSGPKAICCAPDGSIYIADTESHTVRRITEAGAVLIVAGTGTRGNGSAGDPRACMLARPHGVFVDAEGTVFIGDSENGRVRMIS